MAQDAREIAAEALGELRQARGRTSPEVRFRVEIVLAFFEGASYKEIQGRYRTSSRTIAKWIERYRTEGLPGLRDRPKPGREPVCRTALLQWLPEVVHQSPRLHGFEQDRWTLETLRLLCTQQTGLEPSRESVRRALHRFGQSWKRAKHAITSPDPEYEAKRGQS